MSIPSDPLQPHSIPPKIEPSQPPMQPAAPGGGPTGQPLSSLDPTGAWTRFLSTPGHPASPKDVEMFIQGLLRMFDLLIQQQTEQAQKAAEKLKKVAEGKDE